MCRKLIYSISLILVLGLAVNARAGLEGYWKFDEGSGTTAADSSGKGRDGTISGAAWASPGWDGTGHCLDFDGQGTNRVSLGTFDVTCNAISIACWFKADNLDTPGDDPRMISKAVGGANDEHWFMISSGRTGDIKVLRFRLKTDDGTTGELKADTSTGNIELDVWTHVAAVWDGAAMRLYKNGVEVGSLRKSGDAVATNPTAKVAIGNQPDGAEDRRFDGLIDEVLIFDRAMSAAQVQDLVNGVVPTWPKAVDPNPVDGEVVTDTWTPLVWLPGDDAVSHDVYFGDNLDEVTAGTGDTFWGNQATTTFVVGVAGSPYPDGLVLGTTYYWRIDEVQADGTTSTGDIWSFSLPPGTAQEPVPLDGGSFIDADVTLSWTPGFGAVLHNVYFGENAADVAAGAPATYKGPQPGTTYNPGPLEKGKTYYWRIDEFDAATTYTGDVWSFTTRPDIPITDPNLVGWWKLDDVGSGAVIDFSGYGRDGTLVGDAHFVPGYDGDAVDLDGSGDYVTVDGWKGLMSTSDVTVTAWVNTTGNGTMVFWGRNSGGRRVDFRLSGGRLRIEHGGGNLQGDTILNDGEWHHVALMIPAGATCSYPDVKLYLDGEDDSRNTTDPDPPFRLADHADNVDVTIGRRVPQDDRHFPGVVDDVRIYDKLLTIEEIQLIMLRPDLLKAWGPSPANASTPDLLSAGTLSWSPGDNVAQHDVYVGTDAQAVAGADASDTTGIYRARQAGTSYTPLALEPTQTYYWRIDQYNTDGSITKGYLWSLTVGNFVLVDDFEAYNDINPDEPGSNRIFLTWIGGDDDPANGSQVGHNTAPFAGQAIVNRGLQSMPLFYNNTGGIYSEAKMTLTSSRDWTQYGVKALTLSFRGYEPSVGSFTEDPAGTYTLAARGADIWNNTGLVAGYHDEFHFAYKQLTGAGSIVAKVESVSDKHNWVKACVMIRDTLDPDSAHGMMCVTPVQGVAFQRRLVAGDTSTGTTVAGIAAPQWVKIERDIGGNVTASYSDDGITWTEVGTEAINMGQAVYIGLALTSHDIARTAQAVFSNVTITGQVGPVWANQDIGILSNDPEPMYVAVANSTGAPAVVYQDDPAATQTGGWTEWNIDLKAFSDQGINLADIDSIAIGFGDRNNPVAGGAGKMYFDDIRLYLPRCVASLARPAVSLNEDCVVDYLDLDLMVADWLKADATIATAAPDATGLLLHYKFDGNADDSSGNGYHGIEMAGPSYVAGKFDQALSLDGFDDYVAIRDMNYASAGHTEVTVCAWIRTSDPGNQMIVSFDRNEYWRLQIAGEAGGPGLVGFEVMTDTGQVDTGQAANWPGNTGRVDDGQWHHLAGTFDNGTLTIYIDGNPQEPYFGGATFGSGNVRYGYVSMGSEATGTDGRMNPLSTVDGELDDVRIYSRALSQAEIAYLADDTPGDGQLYAPLSSPARAIVCPAVIAC